MAESRRRPESENPAATPDSSTQPDFHVLEGRRHLINAPYMLPKDVQETHRLDVQHVLLSTLLSGNSVAPIQEPHHILDVGCGTGRWCLEMARTFPDAHVTGIDIVVPSTPAGQEAYFCPANCTFLAGDVLQGLPFADESFDVVHQRLLMGAIPASRWQDVVKELARVARPGGWIELVESAAVFPKSGPHTQQISQWIIEASQRRNIDVLIGTNLESFLREAGVEKVNLKTLSVPMGDRSNPIERMSADVVLALFESLKSFIVTYLAVSVEEYDRLLALVPQEWQEYGTVNPFYIAYGQRQG